MKIAVMSFGLFISTDRRPFQKRLFEEHIRWDFDYSGMKKKFKFIDNKSIKKRNSQSLQKPVPKKIEVLLQLDLKIRNENTDLIVQKYMAKFS
jgi:TATA-binding protein-associated factor Taf7